MSTGPLHEFHRRLGGEFLVLSGAEAVRAYREPVREHTVLRESAGLLDLSYRSRLCLLGADRRRFLHGQVTHDIQRLAPGQGCYAALVTAKGRMVSDLNVFVLENEILLDFEPGLSDVVAARLDKYIIADDVQIAPVREEYGLLSVQGPASSSVMTAAGFDRVPVDNMAIQAVHPGDTGEIYVARMARTGTDGFDVFVPHAKLLEVAEALLSAVEARQGGLCGWNALETARIEAGIPRFGADMDETNLPPEAGLEQRAISYTKGCYIGQEIIARIRTYGQVAKSLRGLRLADDLPVLPPKGEKLRRDGKEVGYITSAAVLPGNGAKVALGYVRREACSIGTELELSMPAGSSPVRIVELPFRPVKPLDVR